MAAYPSARVTATARQGLCPDPRRSAASCQRIVPRPTFGRVHGIGDPRREPWRRDCVDCQSLAVVALHAAPRWLPRFRVCGCDPLLSGGDGDGHGKGGCSQLHATRLRAYCAWTRPKQPRRKQTAPPPRHRARKFDCAQVALQSRGAVQSHRPLIFPPTAARQVWSTPGALEPPQRASQRDVGQRRGG